MPDDAAIPGDVGLAPRLDQPEVSERHRR